MMWWNGWFITPCRYVLFVCILALTLTRCGGDDDGEKNQFGALSGNYTGTIQDSLAGAGIIVATLSQSDSSLSGTLQITFADLQDNTSGTLSGTVNGSAVNLTFTPSDPLSCPFNAALTQVSATQIAGSYVAFNCSVAVSGTVNITKQ